MEKIKAIVEKIVEKYKKAGMIDQEEMLKCFSGHILSEKELDYVMKTLDENYIQVLKTQNTDEPDDEELEMIEEDNEVNEFVTDDLVKQYMHEAASESLLTPEEEIVLAKRMEDAQKAAEKYKQASAKERVTLDAIIKKGREAKDELITRNLRLVINIAKRYVGRGMSLLDMIQEGNIGLIRSTDRFDYRRGYKFSTYATWWIRQSIARAIADQGRTIRLPVHMVELTNRLRNTERKLTMELCREPSKEELALAMELPVERVLELKQLTCDPVSLDTPVGEEEDNTLGNFIADDSANDPLDFALSASRNEQIGKLLSKLTQREKEIIIMRFGLDGNNPMTLEEIGNIYHLTRERIRQIEAKGIRKMRKGVNKRIISDFA